MADTPHDFLPKTEPKRTAYIGDGVYATFSDNEVCLKTERIDGEHTIFLAEDSIDALIRFLARSGHVMPSL